MSLVSLNKFLILSHLAIAVHGGALCSDNPACSGLEGACCPTSDGISLSCCEGSNEPSESCTDNSACSALGLTGSCCPTAEGNYLDCCSGGSDVITVAPQCSAHAACSGVSGECCPTQDGVFLECCYGSEALTVAACDAYPACQAAGLTGLCCATAEGVYLECCDGLAQQATQCSAHGGCSGLLGECCPTADGVFLDCCGADASQTTRECSANSACDALGLEGNCCPPDFGSKNLECCHGEQAVATPAIGQLCSENSGCAAIGLEGSCCPTAHGVELHCCDSNTSSQTEAEPPVNPPITIRYVTGIPITTPKPSFPPTPAPIPFTVSSPNEVTTTSENEGGDNSVILGVGGDDQDDGNESTQFNENVADDGQNSLSSVNQLVGQQASSAVGKSRASARLGLGMVVLVASRYWR